LGDLRQWFYVNKRKVKNVIYGSSSIVDTVGSLL